MEGLGSQYLSASAGSGKTVALSVRYCRLVAAGIAPDAICALTFTRAATREIFAAVVKRLTEKNDLTGLGDARRTAALERVLEALPRLQISTIDAFSAKIARLFAYELGLNPDFSLYEEGSGPEAREALRETVRHALRVTSRSSAEALLRRLNVRYDGAAPAGSLSERLQGFICAFRQRVQAQPEGWGDLSALGCALPKRCGDREARMETLRAQSLEELSEKHQAAFLSLLEGYHPEVDSLRELKARWRLCDWKAGKFRALAETGLHTYYKKALCLTSEARAAAEALWDDLVARDLEQSASHTAALREAVGALEEAYAAWSSETGRLGFSELTHALARTVGGHLSVLDAERMYVAYRLDAAVRHLMIDEFQDTGTEQWAVLSGMAHELSTAEDGTFFYVGDTKQSIYGWRGGDATLFGDPTRVPAIPAGRELVESYRSSPDIIALVNRVFALPEGLEAEAEPWQCAPLAEWRTRWRDHIAHRHDAGRAEAILLKGHKQEWMASLAAFIAARWRTLSGRKLSVAVLASTNALFQGNGEEEPGLLARLRALGVDCAIDGRHRVSDAPMGRLVAALLHWMADPRATLWGEVARRLGLAERSDSATLAGWMGVVAREGFVAWADALFAPCDERLTHYDREILEAIRQGLEGVDAKGSTDPFDAWTVVSGLEVPCSADANVLSLMTIHHSKGLTFDVAFTVLAGDLLNERGEVCESGAGWVLERPVLGETYEAAPTLMEAREARRERRFRDDLCALYVSLTRARREQVVLAPKKEAESLKKRAGLVFRSLSGLAEPVPEVPGATRVFALGNPEWWQGDDVAPRTPPLPEVSRAPWQRAKGCAATEVELPSERARTTTLADLLEADADAARHFGITEHARLAAMDWLAPGQEPPEPLPGVVRTLFQKPAEPCELWRERPFSVRVSERGALRYLAGQFDRVHLFPGTRRAIIYDFKTARRAEASPGYVRQLADYRAALAALTGWPKENLRTVLVFTRANAIVEVAHG